MKIAILGGTVLFDLDLDVTSKELVKTDYGNVEICKIKENFLLDRHGKQRLPAHSINHRANLKAIQVQGADLIIALNSVGSLKSSIPPGTIVIPDDYMQLQGVPTFFDNESKHITPNLGNTARQMLVSLLESAKLDFKDGGIYFQAQGPRIETKAEIRFFSQFADIIGMTLANEAALAQELGIPYSSICFVDNFANGLHPDSSSSDIYKDIRMQSRNQHEILKRIILNLISLSNRK